MKLNDFDNNIHATKALKENYKMNFDVSNMNLLKTKDMLKKVRSLAMEAKESGDFYKGEPSPSYMKLVFMEEALVNHYNQLKSNANKTQIVVENEVIEESQVYLAAQAMVDEVEKMIKTVAKMQVEELPALVDSIESEIGVNESGMFQEQVGAQLDTLSAALRESQKNLKAAVNQLTEVDGGFEAQPDVAAGQPEMGDMGMGQDDTQMAPEEPIPQEEPEEQPMGGVGRAKR